VPCVRQREVAACGGVAPSEAVVDLVGDLRGSGLVAVPDPVLADGRDLESDLG
jgi:hypothetical protein